MRVLTSHFTTDVLPTYDKSIIVYDAVVKMVDFNNLVNISDTGNIASGAFAVAVGQCIDNCQSPTDVEIDLTGLPTLTAPTRGIDLNGTAIIETYALAFLICDPHADFETREVRNDGHGRLTVLNTSYPTRQGNLHPEQTNLLLSNLLSNIDQSGPSLTVGSALGSEVQATLIFGPSSTNLSHNFGDPPLVIKPAPLENITDVYAHMLQSSSKLFLSGLLSKAYVPGRLSTEQVIFTSSLPQVVVSTVLFFVLCVVAAASHFRREIPKFTLFAVAASLDGSDVPRVLNQVRGQASRRTREPDMVAALGGRSTVIDSESRGHGPVLHLQ